MPAMVKRSLAISAELTQQLDEMFGIGEGQPPVTVFAWFDRRSGTIRRCDARYANGWIVRINFDKHGKVSSRSANVKLSTKTKGQAA